MAEPQDFHITFTPPVDPMIDAYLAEIGLGFNPGVMRRHLRREIMKLNAMTDAQLALFGISRAEIAAHVFRRVFPEFAPRARRAA